MVPQNAHQGRTHQQSQQAPFSSFPSQADSSFLLDSPQVAKQMAALNAASQARIAQNTRTAQSSLPVSGGTSSGPYLGAINSHSFPQGSHDLLNNSSNSPSNFQMPNNYGLPQPPNAAMVGSFLDPTIPQGTPVRNQTQTNPALKQRQMGFLQGLANVMAKRGTPLPPSLTGVPVMNYDPAVSHWSIIEPSEEVGAFRLAGKDVDLFKLWGAVSQLGGSPAVTSNNAWGTLLHQFDLPEHSPDLPNPVAQTLGQYYMAILYPFEELYKKNMQDQQKKAQLQRQQGGIPGQFPSSPGMNRPNLGMPNMQQQQGLRPASSNSMMVQGMNANGLTPYPQMGNQNRLSSQIPPQIPAADPMSQMGPPDIDPLAHSVDSNLLEQDMQGIKRKLDYDGEDPKRARQKTDTPEANPMLSPLPTDGSRQVSQSVANLSGSTNTRQQPSRRKIEYVPLAREVQTYGGRDLSTIEQEWNAVLPRRPLRDVQEWGTIDIECLSMSIRSRLSVELSYALTTFIMLSTMRGQAPGSGFPIEQCSDLLDDVLDLMEETAFGEPEKTPNSYSPDSSARIFTHKELVTLVQDTQHRPFAALEHGQGSHDISSGPQRPGNIILAVTSIIRNLSNVNVNIEYLANHPRLLDMLLRLCTVEQVDGKPPSPLSKSISLSDLLNIRRDTIAILGAIAGLIHFPNNASPTTYRTAWRTFDLCASYLVDPADAVTPITSVQLAGVGPNPNRRPSALADAALEVFTRFSQNDSNRHILGKVVPTSSLWLLVTMLVYRLPVLDIDFALMQREHWLSFIEKIVMALYSLVFLGSYELKQKIKHDHDLGFKRVLFRLVRKFLLFPSDNRMGFSFSARRAVETLKLLDKAEETVDHTEPTMPVLSFGMGWADANDSNLEKGTGMLGANRDYALDLLLTPDVFQDETFFNELESMVRVECL